MMLLAKLGIWLTRHLHLNFPGIIPTGEIQMAREQPFTRVSKITEITARLVSAGLFKADFPSFCL
jgi:hypothetical protein